MNTDAVVYVADANESESEYEKILRLSGGNIAFDINYIIPKKKAA